MSDRQHRRKTGDLRWADVPVLDYKAQGSAPFKDITRQLLFDDASLGCQLRYFEIAPGGHSTLERHQHVHAVMVINGHGRCLIGQHITDIGLHDLVQVPALTWHQFRAADAAPLGFLCMVNRERDRPALPDAGDLAALCSNIAIKDFIRC